MAVVVPIVEGDGDVQAVPVLIRKLLGAASRWDVQVGQPRRASGKGNLTRAGGLERLLQLLRHREPDAAVLVLVDADEECAYHLARELAKRAFGAAVGRPVAVVAAKMEFETWVLASLETIAGRKIKGRDGISQGAKLDRQVEEIGDPKGWITQNFPQGRAYKETTDQAPLADLIDPATARANSRSFRRLEHAVQELLQALDLDVASVTPA